MSAKKKILRATAMTSVFALLFFYQNCSKVSGVDNQQSIMQASTSSSDQSLGEPTTPLITNTDKSLQYAVTMSPSTDYVCSPFGSVSVPSNSSGLKTELRYIDQSKTLSSDPAVDKDKKNNILSTQYFDDTNNLFIKVPETIYLSDVNVPTRKFTSGFTTSQSKTLTDNSGQTLIEYFALKMDTVLVLGANDPEGYYELASISDDGTTVQIMQNGQWVTIIDNDNHHPTKMGCMNSSNKIQMTKSTRLPLRIYYNQGPRDEIADVLVWNYRGTQAQTSSDLASDSTIHTHCGQQSNVATGSVFWDATQNSAQGPLIKDVFSENWKVLTAANFQLPDNEVNPCSYNKYDVVDKFDAKVINDKNIELTLDLNSAGTVTVNLYSMSADGQTKIKVNSMDLDSALRQDFSFQNLDPNLIYKIELIINLPDKQLKVYKEYQIKLSPIGT